MYNIVVSYSDHVRSSICWRTIFFFFFFQAEDGIRDLVRSRGLGDVYKRQEGAGSAGRDWRGDAGEHDRAAEWQHGESLALAHTNAVSYTHLTLPTSDLV